MAIAVVMRRDGYGGLGMGTAVAAPQLLAAPRFRRSYGKASPALRKLARGAVHDLVRAFIGDQQTWTRRYDRVASLSRPVLEIDISGGKRMLAVHDTSSVVLLDMGDHELVPRAKGIDIDHALDHAVPADDHFYPQRIGTGSLFEPTPTVDVFDYGAELDPTWLYRLDDEQFAVYEQLQDLLTEQVLDEKRPLACNLVVGGPGTGKTSLLASLAEHAVNALGLRVRFLATDGVLEYLQRSTLDVLDWRRLANEPEPDAILIDDPTALTSVEDCWSLPFVASRSTRLVVAGFDPLQLEQTLEDAEFDEFVARTKSQVHELRGCYRQKENVGRATKQVMDALAKKTAFRAHDKRADFQKRHHRLTDLANELQFTNPLGYSEIHDPANHGQLFEELGRVIETKRYLHHWPSVLLVLEDADEYRELSPEQLPFSLAICGFHQVEYVKGLEFPHVFVFLRQRTYRELMNTTNGPGKRAYGQQRRLRIPFSRARDSLVTFVLDHDTDVSAWFGGLSGAVHAEDGHTE
jgi:hypothetical protein